MRPLCAIVLIVVLAAGQWPQAALPAAAPPDRPSKVAAWVTEQTAAGETAEFLLVLTEQANISGAAGISDRRARGRYVYDTLWQTAQATQGPLLAWLAANKVPHRAYYIVNLIWVKGNASVVAELAARADVARVEGNPRITNSLSQLAAQAALPAAPTGVESSLEYVKANEVWDLGFTGQGIVIGGQDTGYQWDHPALKPHYRGWNGSAADHDFNWHDSIHEGEDTNTCGVNSPNPCDDHGHGTHTMGTAVGNDGGANEIGMAPGAQWIGCRNMDEGIGTPATYLECFEWFLAPYPVDGGPEGGNPDMAPDVTNNSWSCPPNEGCAVGTLQAAVEAQRAAGIFTVVSAGNLGSDGCSSVVDPPAVYDAAYTVGALDASFESIAGLSSRGPVTVDGSQRRKPDITAPGINIRSSYLASTYKSMSGTSMAVPHVTGAVALLWSAWPEGRGQIEQTEDILNQSAFHIASSDCNSSGWPNNTFGFGRLDVRAAVDLVLEHYYMPLISRSGP